MVASCGGEDTNATSDNLSTEQQHARHGSGLPIGLARLPDDLLHVVERRREYVARIEVEPMLADGTIDDAAIRDVLRRHQDLVDSAVSASQQLHGTLPPHIELTDDEIGQNLHLSQPHAILVNNVQLLRADAVRCWEERALEACADRFNASLRIAAFLLSHDDQHSRFRGGQAFIPLLFDLNAVCEAGFSGAAPVPVRSALREHLRGIDPGRCLSWDEASEAGQVRRSLLQSLS